jgi:hypothetical protein
MSCGAPGRFGEPLGVWVVCETHNLQSDAQPGPPEPNGFSPTRRSDRCPSQLKAIPTAVAMDASPSTLVASDKELIARHPSFRSSRKAVGTSAIESDYSLHCCCQSPGSWSQRRALLQRIHYCMQTPLAGRVSSCVHIYSSSSSP